MAFQVDITEPALIDAEDHVRFIRDVKIEPDAAERWFRGLIQAIYSLDELPERCPIIPEQEEFAMEIRHLIYYSHRIIFRVECEMRRNLPRVSRLKETAGQSSVIRPAWASPCSRVPR